MRAHIIALYVYIGPNTVYSVSRYGGVDLIGFRFQLTIYYIGPYNCVKHAVVYRLIYNYRMQFCAQWFRGRNSSAWLRQTSAASSVVVDLIQTASSRTVTF